MATPIGTNAVNSLSRRILMPQLVDNVYTSVAMFFRANALGKKLYQGGFQIEWPQIYAKFSNGGSYQGFDLLDIAPNDTVKNAAWDWKQYYSPVSIDNLSLTRADHPEAVANLLTFLFEQSEIDLVDKMGGSNGIWSDCVTNQKNMDGLKGAVDDGTVAATYAGLLRSSNTWWKSQFDSSTTTMTLASLRTMMGNCTQGGRHPTIIFTTQLNYNRFWALTQATQAFPTQPTGSDEQLAQAGFTNLLFDGVPLVVDSGVPASHIFFINERYLYLVVKSGNDFRISDFVQPSNQDAYTALITWYGNLLLGNPSRSGKMTAVAA